eukprot:763866-Hanusia_phi.AAC.5
MAHAGGGGAWAQEAGGDGDAAAGRRDGCAEEVEGSVEDSKGEWWRVRCRHGGGRVEGSHVCDRDKFSAGGR